MARIAVRSMHGHPEWIAPCALWWHAQWGQDMGYSIPGAVAAIEGLTAPRAGQAALVALVDGAPAGSVFLIDKDLPSHAHLAPWLAGLFVLPEYRRMGVAQRLVSALMARAAAAGHASVYLYTAIPQYYRQRGWVTCDTIVLAGSPYEVMSRSAAG